MMIYLSYPLDIHTPSYGNYNQFKKIKNSEIIKGDTSNNTIISTTVHMGTHVDLPYHFYENGQTIEDFEPSFWSFSSDEILFIELKVDNEQLIIRDALINDLEEIKSGAHINIQNIKLLLVKTGICLKRGKKIFWESNFGFHPDIADFLRDNFPNLRIFGFDSISVSSFKNRTLGREAHRSFLNPNKPILLLEDVNLCDVDRSTEFEKITIAPLLINDCDGLPCTILAEININHSNSQIFGSNVKNILWDFDGVLLDSMKIKAEGFKTIFSEYPKDKIKILEKYHYDNGGVSRFEKIKYFYEKIIGIEVHEDLVDKKAREFASVISQQIFDKKNLIDDSLLFIKKYYSEYNFHIVSGAEHNELIELCNYFELSKYFITIQGSPKNKFELIKNILEEFEYSKNETILIGDSIGDYEAARKNNILFAGYNNNLLRPFNYIEKFAEYI